MKKVINYIKYCFVVSVVGLSIVSLLLIVPQLTSAATWTDSGNYASSISKGSGTSTDPYVITTPRELAYLSKAVNSDLNINGKHKHTNLYFKLGANIDLSGLEWTPIGTQSKPFQANFNGNNFVVYNIKISSGSDYSGLFGYVSNSKISNLKVEGNIKASSSKKYIGGVVGHATNSEFSSIVNDVVIEATNSNENVGGIIGYGDTIKITKSYNLETISGYNNVGGLIGYVDKSITISHSYNKGKIKGNDSVGGLVGRFSYSKPNNGVVNVTYSYNKGVIEGKYDVGGVIGRITNRYNGELIKLSLTINYLYNKANIQGSSNVGGIIGQINLHDSSISFVPTLQISNLHNYGNITMRYGYAVGGIAGWVDYVELSHVSNSGKISGSADKGGIISKRFLTIVEPGQNPEYASVCAGGIIGIGIENKIYYAYNTGNVDGDARHTGGIAGIATNIYYSQNLATISSYKIVGGIAGEADRVLSCTNLGAVKGTSFVGGILGELNSLGVGVYYCSNHGSISATDNAGGIVGYMKEEKTITVDSCYNAGSISGGSKKEYIGAIVGRNYHDNGDVINVYYLDGKSNPNKALGTSGGNGTDYKKCYKISSSDLLTAASKISSIYFKNVSGNYPQLYYLKTSAVSIKLETLQSSIWEIRSYANDGDPVIKEMYW